MTKNEGTVDRVIRVALGIGVLSLAFIGPKTMLGYLGIIPLVTGLIGWCPIYTALGFKTCSDCEEK
jgi:cadmium resistance protein CadD (predicted permease)